MWNVYWWEENERFESFFMVDLIHHRLSGCIFLFGMEIISTRCTCGCHTSSASMVKLHLDTYPHIPSCWICLMALWNSSFDHDGPQQVWHSPLSLFPFFVSLLFICPCDNASYCKAIGIGSCQAKPCKWVFSSKISISYLWSNLRMSFLSMFIKNVKAHFKRLGTLSNLKF
jgi:hypothetical protein